MRDEGHKVGSLAICSFRPFPLNEVRDVLKGARRVVVLEKSLAVGIGGMVSDGVRKALSGIALKGHSVIAGLGGRAITRDAIIDLLWRGERDELPLLSFLDLRWDVVKREIAREQAARRAGPIAENILRDLGVVGVAD
jgi:pyruvate ferredoxin oxidoreductase alpha subunit